MGIRSEIWTATGSWLIQINVGEDAQLCMGHRRVFFCCMLEVREWEKDGRWLLAHSFNNNRFLLIVIPNMVS
ncbi:hypothetical protein SAMN04488689_103138 [Paenibacillus sp. cl6col]|nr:hypothetical protein SAMN04488689_103138 [Paenibacillus sp. cl6col]